MIQTSTPSPASVIVVHAGNGRPREIRAGGKRLPVSHVEALRDETAAYPLESGPRRVFVVRAAGGRYRLVHLLRTRRWTLEVLVDEGAGLANAA